MINLKTERDRALQKAYAFARNGNPTWAQLWIDRAGAFLPPTSKQVAYGNRLLRKAREMNASEINPDR